MQGEQERVEQEMERIVDMFHADEDTDFRAYAREVVALREAKAQQPLADDVVERLLRRADALSKMDPPNVTHEGTRLGPYADRDGDWGVGHFAREIRAALEALGQSGGSRPVR